MEEIYFGKKVYDTKVICDVLGVNFEDSKHRKRDIERKLGGMGFPDDGYKVAGKKVEFYWTPDTPEEKINYLVKLLGIQIQSPRDFAIFMYALARFEEYECMPRKTMCEQLNQIFGTNLQERNTYNWTKTMEKFGEIVKDKGEFRIWCSYYMDREKVQDEVNFDNRREVESYKQWCDHRKELLDANNGKWVYDNEFDDKGRKKTVIGILWEVYHVCYYKSYSFKFNAWHSNEILNELFTVVEQLMEEYGKAIEEEKETAETEVENATEQAEESVEPAEPALPQSSSSCFVFDGQVTKYIVRDNRQLFQEITEIDGIPCAIVVDDDTGEAKVYRITG